MWKLLILAALIACCFAAPASEQKHETHNDDLLLQRPSPINPDIPSDPKPADRIIKITDPVEIAKHKRQAGLASTEQPPARLVPTALPPREAGRAQGLNDDENDHWFGGHSWEVETHPRAPHQHQHKRDILVETNPLTVSTTSMTGSEVDGEKTSTTTPSTLHKRELSSSSQAPQDDTTEPSDSQPENKRNIRSDDTTTSTVAPIPLIFKDKNLQPNVGVTIPESILPHDPNAAYPSVLSETHAHTHIKRDIPVPLEPKHHHPEESPKDNDDDKSKEKEKHDHDSDEHDSKEKSRNTNNDSLAQARSDKQQHEAQKKQKREEQKTEDHINPTTLDEDKKDAIEPHAHDNEHQCPIHPTQTKHKREDQQKHDEASTSSTSTTTTEHPVLRPSPVPVAELFGSSTH